VRRREHALVNILEEGRKAMDAILREMMEISEEQAAGDADKIKAMRTCVGWFSSPACALIYQVAKYVALCSSKGYAIGQKFLEWIDARLADLDGEDKLLGHSEDVLAICGSRMYVFFLDAAPTERLISQAGSLLTFLEEEDDLGAEGGGKLRKSILLGAGSPPCMAALCARWRSCATLCCGRCSRRSSLPTTSTCSTCCRRCGPTRSHSSTTRPRGLRAWSTAACGSRSPPRPRPHQPLERRRSAARARRSTWCASAA
jgi:hypothetical protein